MFPRDACRNAASMVCIPFSESESLRAGKSDLMYFLCTINCEKFGFPRFVSVEIDDDTIHFWYIPTNLNN